MFKVLTDGCEPTRGSKFSACIDLYASEDCIIAAGETKIIGLGVAIDLDALEQNYIETRFPFLDGNYKIAKKLMFRAAHYLELHPRSSLRAKGLISNTGIIDLDYEDEIKIIIHNPIKQSEILNYIRLAQHMDESSQIETEFKIKKGDKIAQITLLEHKSYLFRIESDEERNGGFGSTGK